MTDICDTSSGLLTLENALAYLRSTVKPVTEQHNVPLLQALGRVLAQAVYSPIDLPSARNSAMDGYAFHSASLNPMSSTVLKLVGTVWAGKPWTGKLQLGECVRIFTGGALPEEADSVAIQEQVQVNQQQIQLTIAVKPKQHVRFPGEDVRAGEKILPAGKKLTAIDLGLLAAMGISEVSVLRPIKIAFFSTGDELVPSGQTLMLGQVYDSNRYTLRALLDDYCYELTDLGTIADDPVQLTTLLTHHAAHYDVLLSTGGASVGDADHIQRVLAHCGRVNFWKIAIKPGKPFAFGQIDNCYFLGLPGNPGAVVVTAQQLVIPALQMLCGAASFKPWRITATCTQALKKTKGRLTFLSGLLTQTKNNDFEVCLAGPQGSHLLSSLSKANCYIVLDAECQGVQPGDPVTVELF